MNGRYARISSRFGSALRSCSSPPVRSLSREDHVPWPSRQFGRLTRIWNPPEKSRLQNKSRGCDPGLGQFLTR